jgi:hypothetical protein
VPEEQAAPQPSEHDWLIEFLRDRDVNCPLCGYNLRELASDRCPECGREVRLKVLAVEPFLKAWVTAAVALGASAGIGVFVAAIVFNEGWPPARMYLLWLALIYFLLSIPLFTLVLFFRRVFVRAGRPVQRILALLSLTLLGVALLLFFVGLEQ